MDPLIKPTLVPVYRAANNLDEAMNEIKAHTYPYDPNTIHSLVMMYHNTLIKAMLAERPRHIELPAGYTMNGESDRYLSIHDIKILLKGMGFYVTVEDPS